MKKRLTASIIGNWFIGGMSFDEEGILVITPEGRVVRFPTSVAKPRMNQTIRLWASQDIEGYIRFRPSPSAEGWLRGVEISGPCWTMIAVQDGVESRFPCRYASGEFLPPWFEEFLSRNLSFMGKEESKQKAEQAVAPNRSLAPSLNSASSDSGSEDF